MEPIIYLLAAIGTIHVLLYIMLAIAIGQNKRGK
jgi:hypothetical protein